VCSSDLFHIERAEAVAEEVRAAGVRALPIAADITDLAAVQEMVRQGISEFGGIDILVNNAGNAGPVENPADAKPFWETGPEDWAKWTATNFFGVLNACKAVVPSMIERKYGRIITVISDAGRIGEPHLAVYSGAKAGAAGFMRALAKAVGRWSITANCVALSSVRTPGIAGYLDNEDEVKAMLRGYVIRRLGEPDDAANLILFLGSDAASWITGQTYPVNGGYATSA
jgi:3-oxoacyl-[acyl-carrier protein] reductase